MKIFSLPTFRGVNVQVEFQDSAASVMDLVKCATKHTKQASDIQVERALNL